MAFRRRNNAPRSGTIEDFRSFADDSPSSVASSPSLATQAIRASAAHRDSSLSSAYNDAGFSSNRSTQSRWSAEYLNSEADKGPEAIGHSLREFGGTIKNAFEEGLAIAENRAANMDETKKHQMRKRSGIADTMYQYTDPSSQFFEKQTEYETQLKASRDVANAMAAKAKLLLRELKTVKADLTFEKERTKQLEEENKILRENRQKGANPADDDLIRVQLETLLAEKARLANENSTYARENRFLREIVEYHQLTMQDVVYLDEQDIEEVIEEVDDEVDEVLSIHERMSLSSPSPARQSPIFNHTRSPTPKPMRSPSPSTSFGLGSPKSPRRNILEYRRADADTDVSPASPRAERPVRRSYSSSLV